MIPVLKQAAREHGVTAAAISVVPENIGIYFNMQNCTLEIGAPHFYALTHNICYPAKQQPIIQLADNPHHAVLQIELPAMLTANEMGRAGYIKENPELGLLFEYIEEIEEFQGTTPLAKAGYKAADKYFKTNQIGLSYVDDAWQYNRPARQASTGSVSAINISSMPAYCIGR